MIQYYFFLGIRSLRRNPVLTSLMVLTLAIGVAASVSTLTILHMMSSDPIPSKSDRLFVPVMDNSPLEGYVPGAPIEETQLSYPDVTNFLKTDQGVRRVAVYGVQMTLEPSRPDLRVADIQGLAVSADYFAMFEVPFSQGQGWTSAEEKNAAKVVVLSQTLSEKLFGKESALGKRLRMQNNEYQVIGVLGKWNPLPRFTHLINGSGGSFKGEDEFYIPFNTATVVEIGPSGSMWCHGPMGAGFKGILASDCTWLQFWFETATASDHTKLLNYLNAYTADQKKVGRYPRGAPNLLLNVKEWMSFLKIVRNDSKLSAWLAFGFLLLCLVNTAGLLLAKFSVRSSEVGVRRALGASRADIFMQFFIETGVIGLVGGLFGLILSFGGLWLISRQSGEMAVLAKMDWNMLVLTFILAVSASVLAGLLPTWRACQVTPALQLKSQ